MNAARDASPLRRRSVPLFAFAAVVALVAAVGLESGLLRGVAGIVAAAAALAAHVAARRRAAQTAGTELAERDGRAGALLAASDDLRRALEARWRGLLDVPQGAVLVVDGDGVVCEAGAGAEPVFGHGPEAIAGRRLDALIEIGPPAADEAGGAWVVSEAKVVHAPAVGRLLELAVGPLRGAPGAQTRFVVARDLSVREAAIGEARRARDEAEQAMRTRSEFLANMSHEIRTPMNGLLGMLALLAEESLTQDQREIVDHVRRSASSLLSLVNDLLDLSRLTTGSTVLEVVEFDVLGLVEDVAIMLAEARANPGVDVVVRCAPDLERFVSGDSGRIRQIVNNLVNNALKFTRRGHVIVGVASAPLDDGRVQLSVTVEDTGIGIAREDLKLVFERFRQLDGSATRRYGGAGLGLAIARDLAELMEGDIEVHSEPGRGSVFALKCVADRATLGAPQVPEVDLSDRRALVATRAGAQGEAIAAMLRDHGAGCDVVSDAAELRAQLDGHDIVFADAALVAEVRRGLDGRAMPPVVGLTAVQERLTPDRQAALGLAARMARPVRLSRCGTVVAQVLDEAARGGRTEKAAARFDARVLLVEDNPVNLLVAHKLLVDLGCEVAVAADGVTALSTAQAETFDLVLMDCQLPGMDGAEVARSLRDEGGRFAALPIVALTAHTEGAELSRFLAAGVDGHLPKPVTRAALVETLTRVVDAARREAR